MPLEGGKFPPIKSVPGDTKGFILTGNPLMFGETNEDFLKHEMVTKNDKKLRSILTISRGRRHRLLTKKWKKQPLHTRIKTFVLGPPSIIFSVSSCL